ncbi:Heavy metal tolerance protein [Lachnellula willkommii]|uniref:Heavy metal tolerance protein n=1 Tax=Lachnellula willkommii TaxID=215461 RepID=A0A559MH67_9HELO|nr:Heavy metal tolerance protein [Lachnellula willkommii]
MASSAHEEVLVAVKAIHYAYPAFVFSYFIIALSVTVCTLQTQALRIRDAAVRRDVILALIFAVTGNYLVECILLIVRGLTTSEWLTGQDCVVYLISSAIAFGIQALTLTDSKFPVWYPYYVTWFVGVAVEIGLLVFRSLLHSPVSAFDYVAIVVQALRICTFILLPASYFGFRNDKKQYENNDAERQSLLRKKLAPKPSGSEDSTLNGNESSNDSAQASGYGTIETTTENSDSGSDTDPDEDVYLKREREAKKRIQKRLKQDGNWFTYAKGFTIFFPYVWPTRDRSLQLRTIFVGVCLLLTNALNVLVPNQLGVMVDKLTKYSTGDLAIAVAYLWSIFGPYMGLMIAATATSYLYVTTKLVSLRAPKRRDYITVSRKEWTAVPLGFFTRMFKDVTYSLMDAERLLELFQTKPTITDSPNAKPLEFGHGMVKFDSVSFAYDKRKPTLAGVSFAVPAGKTVALVGETGGGKSTILKLISRFYDVNGGSISIDGQDIREVTVSSLREKIGVVPQDPTLFNDTIMNNIRYSRIDASDSEVHEACKAAAIHDKIMSFPDGYNSTVGNHGVKLSGGEKQRVAIARAILKRPEIILLDEATSAVDTKTEQLIQEGFNTLCRGRTTFIVAHRLSTIMKADHILVVMNGKIVEQGSHEELIHSKGKYHELWSNQIFIKPGTELPNSRSPEQQKSGIVNDLSPDQHEAELKKVTETTDLESPPGNDDGKKPDEGKNTSEGYTREDSKLKPDAPEFVPLQPATPSGAATRTISKLQKRLEKEIEKEQRRASLSKKTGKKTTKFAQPEDTGTGGESIPAVLYRNQSSRQKKAASQSRNDSDIAAASSAEGQPVLQNTGMQRRRVSAPSDPPSGPQDSRRARPRRTRHWRLKNRAAENGSSTLSGAMTSGETSAFDDRPAAPLASPAEGAPQNSTAVSFAPGS